MWLTLFLILSKTNYQWVMWLTISEKFIHIGRKICENFQLAAYEIWRKSEQNQALKGFSIYRLNLERLNLEWRNLERLNPEWTHPWKDPTPNGPNPEWTQPRRHSTPKGLNPEWTQPRKDSIPTETQSRLDSTPTGTQPRRDSIPTGTQPRQGLNFEFLSTGKDIISPSKYKIFYFFL